MSAPPRHRFLADDLLTAVVIGAVLVAAWPVVLAVHAPAPVTIAVLLAHVCGMLAGYDVVVLIGLMSRVPQLERDVGADRLARWHGRGGRLVLMFTLVHAAAAVVAWAESRGEGPLAAVWHVLRLPWLTAATLGTTLLVVAAVASVRAARRRLSYERWHALHLLVYLGVALGFMHELAGPDLAGHRVVQVLWALMYTAVFGAVLQFRVIVPLRNATRHRLRVVAVVPENGGAVSVIVEGNHLLELRAEAGQFFRWRFLTPDLWWTAHPFSLSAPPRRDRLRLTVKALGDGSTTIQERLEPGTWVLAEGPYGAVTSHRRTRCDVLLIAGGVGITPMRALFEALPMNRGQDLLLLYRVRTLQDVIFREELEAIARGRGARLRYLLSDAAGPMSPELLRHYAPNLVERDVYLCGPPGLAAATRDALRQAGLPSCQLHEERFDS